MCTTSEKVFDSIFWGFCQCCLHHNEIWWLFFNPCLCNLVPLNIVRVELKKYCFRFCKIPRVCFWGRTKWTGLHHTESQSVGAATIVFTGIQEARYPDIQISGYPDIRYLGFTASSRSRWKWTASVMYFNRSQCNFMCDDTWSAPSAFITSMWLPRSNTGHHRPRHWQTAKSG